METPPKHTPPVLDESLTLNCTIAHTGIGHSWFPLVTCDPTKRQEWSRMPGEFHKVKTTYGMGENIYNIYIALVVNIQTF